MRIKQIRKNYKFVPESVDAVSAEIQRFLTDLKAQKKNIIETRLSVEVILLDLMDKYGEEQSFTYAENNFLGKPYITITVEGEAFNPLEKDDDEEFGNWSSALIQNSDYTPAYSYDRGVNTIRINLSKKEVNPIIKLFVAIRRRRLVVCEVFVRGQDQGAVMICENGIRKLRNKPVRMNNLEG